MTRKLGEQQYHVPPPKRPPGKNDWASWVAVLGHYTGMTTQNLAVIAFFGWGGWYLDNRFGTKPYLFVCGIFTGIVLGFYLLYKSIQAIQKDAKK